MNENKKKKKVDRSDNYLETKRVGAVGANIFRRQAPTGYPYYDFNLSRAWKASSSGKEGYSQNFFAKNREALHQAIDEACDRIEELENESLDVAPEPSQEAVYAEPQRPVNGVHSSAT